MEPREYGETILEEREKTHREVGGGDTGTAWARGMGLGWERQVDIDWARRLSLGIGKRVWELVKDLLCLWVIVEIG